jgi:hypothetical protein
MKYQKKGIKKTSKKTGKKNWKQKEIREINKKKKSKKEKKENLDEGKNCYCNWELGVMATNLYCHCWFGRAGLQKIHFF